MRRRLRWRCTLQWIVIGLTTLSQVVSTQAGEEVVSVQTVLSNPSTFHRHSVLLKGVLTLISQWEGSDAFGRICGPMFKLEDGTGDILVMYFMRCDPAELGKATALTGGPVVVLATIDSETVVRTTNDNVEHKIRAIATKIRRQNE